MNTGSMTSIPVDLGDILIKLRFLAKIQRGNKINVNSMDFVDANSLLGSISRAFHHENRNVTYMFINSVIDQAVTSLNQYGPKGYLPNSIFQKMLVNGLYQARRGIAELSSTYRADPETVAKIEVCLEKIDLQLQKFRHLLEHPDVDYSNEKEEKEERRDREDREIIEENIDVGLSQLPEDVVLDSSK